MVDPLDRLNQHVIYIRFHGDTNHYRNLLIDHPLIGDACIDQPKRHYYIVVDITINLKSNMLGITFSYIDLIIP